MATFAMATTSTYLDHASASPLDERARAQATVSRTQELMRRIQSFFGLK